MEPSTKGNTSSHVTLLRNALYKRGVDKPGTMVRRIVVGPATNGRPKLRDYSRNHVKLSTCSPQHALSSPPEPRPL